MTGGCSVKLLQKIPIFRNLNETECRQLADIATPQEFTPGEVILRQGKSSQNLWVVVEGKCEVVKYKDAAAAPRDALVLAVLEPYSHFGEMSFFHPAPHSASVRAQSAVKLLVIARADYDELIEEGVWAAYKLAYNVLEGLADRLRRMDQWVAELASHNPPDHKVPEWSAFRDKLFTGWNL